MQALSDRRLEKSKIEVLDGDLDGATSHYSENSTPRIIVVEAAEDEIDLLPKIDALAEVCDPGTQLIVLGNVNDVQIYRSLTQQGVSDYLVPPFDSKQIFDSIAAMCSDPADAPLGRVITFMGTKGGVGSSTLAHNTAASLAKLLDDDVAIIDLDLAFGTVSLAFNLESQQGVQDALAHPERLDEVLLERFMAKHDEHLFLLTSPGSLNADADIDPEAFDVLLNLVRRTVPFIVLDLPHEWSAWSRHILGVSDEIVLTATLDLASLRDTKSLYDALSAKRVNDPPLRCIINHEGAFKKTQLSVKDFEGAIGSPPILVVPHDPVLFGTAANNGQMIGDMNKRSKLAVAIDSFAQTVSGREPAKSKKKKKIELALFKKEKKEKKE